MIECSLKSARKSRYSDLCARQRLGTIGCSHQDVKTSKPDPILWSRPELLPEDPVLPRRYRRVVEPAGVDRDLVPVEDSVGRSVLMPRLVSPHRVVFGLGVEARHRHITDIAEEPAGPGRDGQAPGEQRPSEHAQLPGSIPDHVYLSCSVIGDRDRGRGSGRPASQRRRRTKSYTCTIGSFGTPAV